MSDLRYAGAVVVAGGLVALAVVIALRGTTTEGEAIVVWAVLAGVAAIGYHLWRRRKGQSRMAPPEADRAALPPERSPDEFPLTGTNLARLLADAERATRDQDDIAAGLRVVRPSLRETLLTVMRESGWAYRDAERALETGRWTDEPAAAAVVDPGPPLPELTFRERVVAWLFPERFLRAYVRATMAEITALADRELPTVPGENAPRPVPVRQPSLARLRQGLDGTPREVADPFGDASRGSDAPDITDGRVLHERLGVVEPEEESS